MRTEILVFAGVLGCRRARCCASRAQPSSTPPSSERREQSRGRTRFPPHSGKSRHFSSSAVGNSGV